MRLRLIILAAACAFLSVSGLSGQIIELAEPASWRIDELMGDDYPVETLPAVNNSVLLAEDAALSPNKSLPTRFAFRHAVDIGIETHGRWTTLKNGDRVWQVGIESVGALAMNLSFDVFKLSGGSKLFIFNEDRSEVLGAITAENNKESEQLGTTHIRGEKLIIELYEPFRVRGENRLHIRSVSHAYKFIDADVRSFGNSGECNVNVDCYADEATKEQSSSVVLMTVDDGTRWCTGTIVNNTNEDGRPYLLSSFESYIGDPAAWVFYFNYVNTECEEGYKTSPLGRSISGAELRASGAEKKFALYELTRIPPFEWQVFYAGWNRTQETSNSARCIHHPGGDVKKISELNEAPVAYDHQWIIQDWDLGTTEPGSAGGSLLNHRGQLIGWLVDGTASCGHPGADVFRMLQYAWDGANAQTRLKDWLDPFESGKTEIERIFPEIAYISTRGFENELAVYPVPAQTVLNFLYRGPGLPKAAILYDLNGRIVRRAAAGERQLDVTGLNAGIYIFSCLADSGPVNRRIVVE